MSHLAARVIKVLQDDRPYELWDSEGKAISTAEAKKLILINFQVPENIRRERRRPNPVKAWPIPCSMPMLFLGVGLIPLNIALF